jgi:hypothetical protein
MDFLIYRSLFIRFGDGFLPLLEVSATELGTRSRCRRPRTFKILPEMSNVETPESFMALIESVKFENYRLPSNLYVGSVPKALRVKHFLLKATNHIVRPEDLKGKLSFVVEGDYDGVSRIAATPPEVFKIECEADIADFLEKHPLKSSKVFVNFLDGGITQTYIDMKE